jgi:hypothetical protein
MSGDRASSVAESSSADPMPTAPILPRRLLDTFFSPGKMVEAVAREPRWLGALLVSIVLVAISTALIPPEMFAEVQRRAALERGISPPPMSDDTLRLIRIFSVAGSALAIAVISFVMSGLYTLVFAFILGDEGTYRQYLAVMVHAAVIPALLSLGLVPLRIQTGDPQFTLSVASFLYFLEPGYVLNVFRLLDLTQLWSSAVVALGVHQIDRRRSFGSAFTVLLLFTLAVALIIARFLPT